MIESLKQLHKETIWAVQRKFNLSDYALLWLSFAKGVIITLLFVAFV